METTLYLVNPGEGDNMMTTRIGALIIDLQGKELTPEEKELLAHPLVGGVILFTRNFDSRQQLKELCKNVRQTKKSPLLIMVDQEGGRVQRFIPEFTRLPPMACFGDLYENHTEDAKQKAMDCGKLMATELLSVGIDMSLAPVLDLNKGMSSVIGDRAFHADPVKVIELAEAFMRGMREAGMATTGKHFPGHGSVSLDSHIAMPIDTRTLKQIENDDLIPFTALIKRGLSALMAAHIVFPTVDDRAVGFSSTWLKTILRERLGFKGVVLSDDLNMEGANISNHFADRAKAAREAGCDFALICNNRRGVVQALDGMAIESNQVDYKQWSTLQGDFSRVSM